ncbi:hypothetical protein [Falsiporphyromonas endometrii]|uniref:Uncharacterized protein n=1 Tax=Falsiporphyromonas endometrii TaxID=1387297 RepID=A0ABV9K8H3_9PORP
MEISILLTILLMMISFGGSFCQEGKICFVIENQINDLVTINHNLKNTLFRCAVKSVFRMLYLLKYLWSKNYSNHTHSTSQ